MKSRQLGYVLMALIVVGVVGLIVRVASAGSDELTLEGTFPVTVDVVDQVTLVAANTGQEATIVERGEGEWFIGLEPAFGFRLAQFWGSVGQIDGAQLVAVNPATHSRLGVLDDQGIRASFFLGGALQEQFIVGKWSPDVRLCYLRRAGKDEVYGIPCPSFNVFDADPDGWRDPTIVTIPRTEVASIEFAYPDEAFTLTPGQRSWIIEDGETAEIADIFVVDGLLTVIEQLIAREFASEDEVESNDVRAGLTGSESISIRILTGPEAATPTTRVRLLKRDDFSYYASTAAKPTVYILDQSFADVLLRRAADLRIDG